MKHISWDYKGYDDLKLSVEYGAMQKDWNATLLSSLNRAYGEDCDKPYNVFISKEFMPIIETICIFDPPTKTVGNIRFIPIDLNTPKLYVTVPYIMKFMGIEHDNYGSVVIKNFE